MEIDEGLRRNLIELIRDGKSIPISYKNLLFPIEEKSQEIELVYGCKERKEDIVADTMSVPFQAVKKFGKVDKRKWHNMLIFGDNLQALRYLKKMQDGKKQEKIKLAYIDPPFATEMDFKGSKGELAYHDRLAGAEFVECIRKRLVLIKELLADDGSLYVHFDYKKGHYIKVVLDELFGENNFRSEIIWKRSDAHSDKTLKSYGNIHDMILFYTKSSQHIWNSPVKTISEKTIRRDYRLDPETGRYFRLGDLKGPGGRGVTYEINGIKAAWKWSKEKFEKAKRRGEIYFTSTGRPFYKKYLDEHQGVPLQTLWLDCPQIKGGAEKTGFPTQKPETLLRRIIEASSNPGDLILDCFAGSGTTGAVAEKLRRRWIMIDSSKLAIYITMKRLLNLKEKIGNKGKPIKPQPFVLYNAGLYEDHGSILNIGKKEYKNFALDLFQVEPRSFEINGLNMDGILFNCPVKVFSQEGFLTEEYVTRLHDVVGEYLKARMFIIAPASRVYFLQDYVEKNGIRYYVLRIPYSIIDELHKQKFTRPVQPASSGDINQLIEAVGFDFIHPPNIRAEYYRLRPKDKLIEQELIIQIKDFEAVQRSKDPIEFKDPKDALSMVLVDRNYNNDYFTMTDYFFRDQIEKENWKVRIPATKIGKNIMIIYLDILGNEAIEVKSMKDFQME